MRIRESFLPFHRPAIDEDEIREVEETLRSGWLTTGPRVRSFEAAFATYIGVRHAIAVNSGTAALHLALDAIGLEMDQEVIVPTLTFTATAEVVTYFRARPLLVDIDPSTMNLDLSGLQGLLERRGDRVKAIIPVHFAGLPCDMDGILRTAQRYGLRIIEDAAHALPAFYRSGDKERMIGTIGDLTAFSFYATKNITTGEGGMITTDNDEYAEKMRIMSLHGISRDAWKRYSSEGDWYYEVIHAGHKYNLTDIAAAIGIHQLRKCDEFWNRRRYIARLYTEGLAELEEIITPYSTIAAGNQLDGHAWHLYVILIRPERLSIDRAQFIEELKQRNIGVSVHFIPLHLHPYYQRVFGYRQGDFPNAEWVYERCISLPIYPKMTDSDVGYVVEAIREIVTKYARIKA